MRTEGGDERDRGAGGGGVELGGIEKAPNPFHEWAGGNHMSMYDVRPVVSLSGNIAGIPVIRVK